MQPARCCEYLSPIALPRIKGRNLESGSSAAPVGQFNSARPASLLTMGFRALILALLVAVGAAAQNTTQREKPAGLERKPAQPLPT